MENHAGHSTCAIIVVLEQLTVGCAFVFRYSGGEKSDIPLTQIASRSTQMCKHFYVGVRSNVEISKPPHRSHIKHSDEYLKKSEENEDTSIPGAQECCEQMGKGSPEPHASTSKAL